MGWINNKKDHQYNEEGNGVLNRSGGKVGACLSNRKSKGQESPFLGQIFGRRVKREFPARRDFLALPIKKPTGI